LNPVGAVLGLGGIPTIRLDSIFRWITETLSRASTAPTGSRELGLHLRMIPINGWR